MEKVKLKFSFSSTNRRETHKNALFCAFFHLKNVFLHVFPHFFLKNQTNNLRILTF